MRLLTFSAGASQLIRSAVEPELFSSQLYREIVKRVYDFLDQFKAPPGAHLPDLLEEILSRDDKEAELCGRLVESIVNAPEPPNEHYVLSQLEGFIRRQRLTVALIKASGLVQEGDVEQAEVTLEAGLRTRLQLFSPGMTLAEGWKRIQDGDVRRSVVPTGIKELDEWELGPARGELHVLMGPPKRAKSWWLVNVGRRALMQRLKVCHISLELPEPQITQRYIQSLFALVRHKAHIMVSNLVADELGRFKSFEREELLGRKLLSDKSLIRTMPGELEALRFHNNLVVKHFPSGMLSMNGLRAYLDALERSSHFVPDVLILDYPDLMEIKNRSKLREELGGLFINLRGLAVERDLVFPTVTQANRAGADAKLLTDTHAAEDFSKIMTADTVLTYSQTLAEKELNLARIFVSNTRVSDHDRFVVLISQAYQIGQFCRQSARMTDGYWRFLKDKAPDSGEES